jgi:hypothetical protein
MLLAMAVIWGAGWLLFDCPPGCAQTTSRPTGRQSPFRRPADTRKLSKGRAGKPKGKAVVKTYPQYVNRRDLYGSSGQGYVPAQPAVQGTRGF